VYTRVKTTYYIFRLNAYDLLSHRRDTSSVRTKNIAPTSGFYFELREIIKRTAKTSHKRGRRYPTSSVIKILRASFDRQVTDCITVAALIDPRCHRLETGGNEVFMHHRRTRVSRTCLMCYTRTREEDRTLNLDVK